ncbi:MAG: nitrophenyl compound nitroreductase subunit ArsF family protein [Flavobacteriaceae bacterium]|nr:nitrophenyl compound nitroreductase subunit ArsF family protein [Flavobacteriaceae bacterium]
MNKVNLQFIALILAFASFSCQTENKEKQTENASEEVIEANLTSEKTEVKTTALEEGNLVVIQFHSENRCKTCNKIEKLSKATISEYEGVDFQLINVDDQKNEAIATKFEASGTALFLHNTATGEFKNLTEFAFMNANNEEKFENLLKEEVETF